MPQFTCSLSASIAVTLPTSDVVSLTPKPSSSRNVAISLVLLLERCWCCGLVCYCPPPRDSMVRRMLQPVVLCCGGIPIERPNSQPYAPERNRTRTTEQQKRDGVGERATAKRTRKEREGGRGVVVQEAIEREKEGEGGTEGVGIDEGS